MDRQQTSKINDQGSDSESMHDSHDGIRDEPSSDLPPLYGALSLHRPASRKADRHASSSTSRNPYTGLGSSELPNSSVSKPAASRPPLVDPASLSLRKGGSALAQAPSSSKNLPWLSLLPFVHPHSTRRVHRSVLSAVHDLVVQPSRRSNNEPTNIDDLLDSMAESCKEHKLSLSVILQERSIADHTPMYWAIVNYREELPVALLIHSQPLSIPTISDIRRACLASSNQTLFHALRICSPPFHETQGLHVPSPRTPSDNLLLGSWPVDEIDVQQSTDDEVVVTFEINLWKRRMNAIGHTSIEFIAAGRMWSITFFSAHTSSPFAISGKNKDAGTWHVMVRLLESSLPTFFRSQIVIDPLPLLVAKSDQTQTLRGARSATRLQSNRAEISHARSEQRGLLSSSRLPSPIHRKRSSHSSSQLISAGWQPPIFINLNADDRKLGCRTGESSKLAETLTTKPNKWSNQGVGYTNAVVSPLGEDSTSRLLHDPSPYLFPDGTLRGQLKARFEKSMSDSTCIIG